MGRKFVGNAEVVGAGARRPMMTTTSCVERRLMEENVVGCCPDSDMGPKKPGDSQKVNTRTNSMRQGSTPPLTLIC